MREYAHIYIYTYSDYSVKTRYVIYIIIRELSCLYVCLSHNFNVSWYKFGITVTIL